VATLFLDADLSIRFFTPAAKALFNVIASDVGRPLADLTRRFEDDDLLADARAVLATQVPVRREVRADDGGWFMRGMLPYRSDERGIEGIPMPLVQAGETSGIATCRRSVSAWSTAGAPRVAR
jgi:two-component system CheB/CheR fusion protein